MWKPVYRFRSACQLPLLSAILMKDYLLQDTAKPGLPILMKDYPNERLSPARLSPGLPISLWSAPSWWKPISCKNISWKRSLRLRCHTLHAFAHKLLHPVFLHYTLLTELNKKSYIDESIKLVLSHKKWKSVANKIAEIFHNIPALTLEPYRSLWTRWKPSTNSYKVYGTSGTLWTLWVMSGSAD